MKRNKVINRKAGFVIGVISFILGLVVLYCAFHGMTPEKLGGLPTIAAIAFLWYGIFASAFGIKTRQKADYGDEEDVIEDYDEN